MDAEAVFEKKLSKTDIQNRLSFPTDKLGILPAVAQDRDPVLFQVSCGKKVYTFCCVKRQTGPLKPVIERGWSNVVQDNDLQPDDLLKFYYMEASDHEAAHYWIEVFRWVYYTDQLGTSSVRHRIV